MPISEGSPIGGPSENNVLQNFSDATAGRSQQLFHCMGAEDINGLKFVLGRDAGNSNPNFQERGIGDSEHDFDITINKPTIVAGLASIDLKWIASPSGTGGDGTYSIDCEIIHYDGSTETVLASLDTKIETTGSAVTTSSKLSGLVTKKLFKIGDILRLKIILSVSTRTLKFHFDPLTAGDELKLWLPIVNLE